MTLKPGKGYGLQIPKKGFQKADLGKVPSVFGDDSSDDDNDAKAKKSVNKDIDDESTKKLSMKQTQIEIQKALKEDPDIYQYDEVYDQMEEKKKESNMKILGGTNTDKKSKYISKLMKSAELRKIEDEHRKERKIQKERDEEGDEFDEKEEFVTSAYRQKIEERAAEAKRIKKQDEIDAANDVTKQKDLSKFYRNLLDKNVAMGGNADEDSEEKIERDKDNEKTKVPEQLNFVDKPDQESTDNGRGARSDGKPLKTYRKNQRYLSNSSSDDYEKDKVKDNTLPDKKDKTAKKRIKNEKEIESIEAELRELHEKEEVHNEKKRKQMEHVREEESYKEYKERRRSMQREKKDELSSDNKQPSSSKKSRKKYDSDESSNSESDIKELEKINKKLSERKQKKKLAEVYSGNESHSDDEMKKREKDKKKYHGDSDEGSGFVEKKIEEKVRTHEINDLHSSDGGNIDCTKRTKKTRKEHSSSEDEGDRKQKKGDHFEINSRPRSEPKMKEKHVKKIKRKYEEYSTDEEDVKFIEKKQKKKNHLTESKCNNVLEESGKRNTTDSEVTKKNIFFRRNTSETIRAAKERYLARLQNLRLSSKTEVQDSD